MNPTLRAVAIAVALIGITISTWAQSRLRAVVAAERTNVRAQPSADAEVLASLAKGQSVEVLGEEVPKGSKEAWSKIAMPAAVTVWVYGPLVDPKKATVKAKEANYRAGPGRNYSVLGELKKGDPIKVVREFDGWVQIEPPAQAVAYVASRLLTAEVAAAETVAAPPSTAPSTIPATPLVPATKVPPPQTKPEPTSLPASNPQTAPLVATTNPNAAPNPSGPKPAPTSVTPTATPPEPIATPTEVKPPAPATASETKPAPKPALDSTTSNPARSLPIGSPRALESAPSRERPQAFVMTDSGGSPPPLRDATLEPRFVVREGVVEATVSPQAPTNYELRDGFYQEGAIDYLLLDPQKALRQFSGKRVMVSGFEYRDSRWRTPVLKVQNIELSP